MFTITDDWASLLPQLNRLNTLLLIVAISLGLFQRKYWKLPLKLIFYCCLGLFYLRFLTILFDVVMLETVQFWVAALLTLGSIAFLPFLGKWIQQRSLLRIPLYKNPYCWIGIGLLLSNVICFVLLLIGNGIANDYPLEYSQLLVVKNIVEAMGYLLLSIGFYYGYYARFVRLEMPQFFKKESYFTRFYKFLRTIVCIQMGGLKKWGRSYAPLSAFEGISSYRQRQSDALFGKIGALTPKPSGGISSYRQRQSDALISKIGALTPKPSGGISSYRQRQSNTLFGKIGALAPKPSVISRFLFDFFKERSFVTVIEYLRRGSRFFSKIFRLNFNISRQT